LLLGLSAAVWLPYGLFCLLEPSFLRAAAGLATLSPTAATEVRAMYGGLQAGLGVLLVVGLVRSKHEQTALRTLAFLCAGLATARFLGVLVDGGVSAYTVSALALETGSAAAAVALLRRGPEID